MNINQVMRGFIGENQTGETKMLELKVGQVVKGTVVKLLGEQEAIVNINGMQVRAKLETPLATGQATMLQVQPESQSGQMVLKPLDSSSVQIETGSMSDLLKSFGMKESPANRQLLQQMHMEGIPLTKENMQGISRMLAAIPADISSSEWMQSAILANKRGLPPTVATITALHQVVFGKPMHQALKQLDEQLAVALKPDSTLPASLKISLMQLQDTIKQIQTISANYSSNLVPDDTVDLTLHTDLTQQELQPGKAVSDVNQTGTVLSNRPALNSIPVGQTLPVDSGLHPSDAPASNAAAQPGISGNSTLAGNPPSISQQTLPGSTQASTTGMVLNNALSTAINMSQVTSSQGSSGNPENVVPSNVIMTGNPDEASDITPGMQNTLSNKTSPVNNTPSSSNHDIHTVGSEMSKLISLASLSDEAVPGKLEEINRNKDVLPMANVSFVEETGSSYTNNTISDENTLGPDNAELISRMLKAIGLEHENQVVKTLDSIQSNIGKTDASLLLDLDPSVGGTNTSVQRDADKAADTLKSLLLQLSTSNDLPPALKDHVHQLLQQVTGQQLFAISDRTSLFSHITLFLPINNSNGEQTASVHVQSRRGKRGELDANNCRLLFDLHMKVLGETVVDVHVVNRIVALQVQNDHPLISEILESNRKEIASAVEKIGYQFLSMKSVPFPVKEEESKGLPVAQEINSSATSLYTSKPYKGVDLRI